MDSGALSADLLKRFAVSRVWKADERKASRITGMDFSRCGQFIVTSSSDDTVKLYSSIDGKLQRNLNVKKFGASAVIFTHHPKAILAAGFRNQDCCVRYHSLHDNSYLRVFRGHQLPIHNLELSPVSDTFLSSSQDKTVRMWDIRQETSVALVRTSQNPVVAFDNEGLIFGIGASRTSLKLFDIRNYGAVRQRVMSIFGTERLLRKLQFGTDIQSPLREFGGILCAQSAQQRAQT